MLTVMNKLAVIVALLSVIATVNATPLDDYVNMPDSSYTYSVKGNFRGFGYTAYVRTGFVTTNLKRYFIWQEFNDLKLKFVIK